MSDDPRTWRPRAGRVLALLLDGTGRSSGGLYVAPDARTIPSTALVFATAADEERCSPGDRVLFAEGTAEPVTTGSGEQFWVLPSHAITLVLEGVE